jgi:glycine cleavage system H protein
MNGGSPKVLLYKRSHFVTQLPVDYLYSPSHAWMARSDQTWRVGLTKFATRMLGEMVDHGFEIQTGQSVATGQVIGWIEGFKAISDLFCIGSGTFTGGNPLLQEKITIVNKDPFGAGWLYTLDGTPGEECMDVEAYRALLDKTIDRIMAQRKDSDES